MFLDGFAMSVDDDLNFLRSLCDVKGRGRRERGGEENPRQRGEHKASSSWCPLKLSSYAALKRGGSTSTRCSQLASFPRKLFKSCRLGRLRRQFIKRVKFEDGHPRGGPCF